MSNSDECKKAPPTRRDTEPIIKPIGHYPNQSGGMPAHRNAEDVTGVNPDHMKPVDPKSVYIPPT